MLVNLNSGLVSWTYFHVFWEEIIICLIVAFKIDFVWNCFHSQKPVLIISYSIKTNYFSKSHRVICFRWRCILENRFVIRPSNSAILCVTFFLTKLFCLGLSEFFFEAFNNIYPCMNSSLDFLTSVLVFDHGLCIRVPIYYVTKNRTFFGAQTVEIIPSKVGRGTPKFNGNCP